jgi:hypothetical protein
MRLLRLLLLFALLPLPAGAQIVYRPGTLASLSACEHAPRLFTADGPDMPAALAGSFAGPLRGMAVRTCVDMDGGLHYFVREPRPNRNGICRVQEREIFPMRDAAVTLAASYEAVGPESAIILKGWSDAPPPAWREKGYRAEPRTLGLMSDAPCPRGDDRRYVPVHNSSDAMLTLFHRQWARIIASPEAFDRAFAAVAWLDDPAHRPATPFSRTALRRYVFEKGGAPTSLACDEAQCRVQFGLAVVRFDAAADGLVPTGLGTLTVY